MSTYTIDLEYAQIESIVRASLIDQIKMLKEVEWEPSNREYEDAMVLNMEHVLRYYSTPDEWDEYVRGAAELLKG